MIYSEADVLAELNRRIEANGLRGFCRMSGVLDPGFVCEVRKGKKPLSKNLAKALGFDKMPDRYQKREQAKTAS